MKKMRTPIFTTTCPKARSAMRDRRPFLHARHDDLELEAMGSRP
jgi:hypothetical protein